MTKLVLDARDRDRARVHVLARRPTAAPSRAHSSYHMVEAASRLLALPLPTDILVGLRIPLLHVAVQVRRATRGGVVASRLPSTKVETVGGERGELTPGLHPMAGGPAS